MKPYLTLVIPAYNEATNIRLGALEKVSKYLEQQRFTWEALIVDDGSKDETPKLLDLFARSNIGFRVIHNPHLGKAGTVIAGVMAAKGEIVLFSDLDQATPISEMKKLLPCFENGYDVVIGSRGGRREGAPISRIIMARGFIFLRATILGLKGITDTQCGFKAFRAGVAKQVFSKLKLYGSTHLIQGPMVTSGFDVEVLFLAKKLNYKIKEVPVEWHYVETRRVNPIFDSFQGLFDILRIRWNSLRGIYA